MIAQFIYLITVFLLGVSFLKRFGKNLGILHHFLLSFPTGLVVWCLTVLVLFIMGLSDQRWLVFLVQAVVFIGCLLPFRWQKKGWKLHIFAIFLAIFTVIALFFLNLNLSFLSNDSWTQVSNGKIITSPYLLPDNIVASSGILTYILHSAPPIFGFDYLYSIFPLMAFFALLLLAVNVYAPEGTSGLFTGGPFLLAILAVIFTSGSFFFFFNTFFVHSGMPAGVAIFIAVFGLWKRLSTGDTAWNAVAVPSLVFFTLVRIEAPLFTIFYLVILFSLEEVGFKEKAFYFGAVFLFLGMWSFYLFVSLQDYWLTVNKYYMTSERVLMVMGAYVLLFVLLFLTRWRLFNRLEKYLPFALVYFLTAGWTYVLFTHGLKVKGDGLILQRYSNLILNVVREGGWGLLWIALIPLFIAAFFLKKIPGESPVVMFIVSFFLFFQPLHLFRGGWRQGWGDSGNRMLHHILPVLIFYVFLKFRYSLFSEKTLLGERGDRP
ncbi:MAG: hypothetical protein JXB26_18770 [Candidatus Aminicenantes bacterium]|nr:hypothetical protein [Candidatus Aminicenantes bacterium]